MRSETKSRLTRNSGGAGFLVVDLYNLRKQICKNILSKRANFTLEYDYTGVILPHITENCYRFFRNFSVKRRYDRIKMIGRWEFVVIFVVKIQVNFSRLSLFALYFCGHICGQAIRRNPMVDRKLWDFRRLYKSAKSKYRKIRKII